MSQISVHDLYIKASDIIAQGGMYSVIIIIALVVLICVSARLFLRLALFFIAVLLIWTCLYAVGLAPCPFQYFNPSQKAEEEVIQV